MRWDMDVEEVEAVLERIWDLHDKLSDAIHSISRSHFLNSVKTPNKKTADNSRTGFVFVKDFRLPDDHCEFAIQEAKSLNAIRTALENLEDQLDFFHTVQTQQRAERDAAIARLEQSRIVLAMRLAEHHGKKYKVIEEALAFVGDVNDASRFVSPEALYGSHTSPSGEKLDRQEGMKSNFMIKALISSFDFAKNSLKLDRVGGILGNAALFAVSMVALLHLHQVALEHPCEQDDIGYGNRKAAKTSRSEFPSSAYSSEQLDVMLARG